MFHIGVATNHPPLPEPGQVSEVGVDFIKACLTIDPMIRPSASELFDHPWMVEIREGMSEYEQENMSDIPSTPGTGSVGLPSVEFFETLGGKQDDRDVYIRSSTSDLSFS